MPNIQPYDPLIASVGPDRYWTGSFEEDTMELGLRAAKWSVDENEGGYNAEAMLRDWAENGYRRF